jgi:hypothetical protein
VALAMVACDDGQTLSAGAKGGTMFSEEAARHELHERLRQAIGDEAATTLMGQLPPISWHETVTKRDLDEFERRLVGQLRADFRSELNAAVTSQTRTTILATLGSAVAWARWSSRPRRFDADRLSTARASDGVHHVRSQGTIGDPSSSGSARANSSPSSSRSGCCERQKIASTWRRPLRTHVTCSATTPLS